MNLGDRRFEIVRLERIEFARLQLPQAADRLARYTREMLRVVVLLLLVAGEANAERLRAPNGEIKEVPDASVEFALKDGYTRLGRTHYREQDGTVRVLYDEPLTHAHATERGWWKMTPAEIDEYEGRRSSESTTRILRELEEEEAASRRPLYIVLGLVLAIAVLIVIVRAVKTARSDDTKK
jgi:hypothetical protein